MPGRAGDIQLNILSTPPLSPTCPHTLNAEPDQRRGAQLDAALDAFRQLRAKGIGGAFAWALDNSASSGYAAEAGLLSIAAERLPLERLPQQQPSASSRLRRLLCCSSGSSADG